jgi:hypothetical protein
MLQHHCHNTTVSTLSLDEQQQQCGDAQFSARWRQQDFKSCDEFSKVLTSRIDSLFPSNSGLLIMGFK